MRVTKNLSSCIICFILHSSEYAQQCIQMFQNAQHAMQNLKLNVAMCLQQSRVNEDAVVVAVVVAVVFADNGLLASEIVWSTAQTTEG